MKTLLLWCTVGLLAAPNLLVAENQREEPSQLVKNLAAGKKQTIVVYGTSLTAGGAWVKQVHEALKSKFPDLVTMINSGGSGKHSKWGLDNLDARVIKKKPDTVIIEFAINDAFLQYKTTVEEAHNNLLAMIDRIQAANAQAEIILMTMDPPVGVHLERRPKINDYYQMYRDTARERKLRLIDHQPNWEKILKEDKPLFNKYVPDGIHPGPEGCQKVITPAILQSLGVSEK